MYVARSHSSVTPPSDLLPSSAGNLARREVPRRDFHKLMYNDKKKLGFTAMFANPKEEDVNRRFVFTYCLWDDQMCAGATIS